jgi:tetratricopeptide (TPR) repeat protein
MAEVYHRQNIAAIARLNELTDLQTAAGNRLAAAVGLWFNGHLLLASAEPELAQEQFTRALNLEPGFVDTLGSTGVLLVRHGEGKRAERILKHLRTAGPGLDAMNWERQALWIEGEMARARGDHKAALALLVRAREQATVRYLAGGYVSDLPIFLDALARTYIDQGDVAAAEKVTRELVELHADRIYWPWLWMEAQVRLAELARRGNRPDEAAEHAAIVRRYWAGAAGEGQSLVDGLLARLDRAVPAS